MSPSLFCPLGQTLQAAGRKITQVEWRRSQQLIWIQHSKVTFASFITEIAFRMSRWGSPHHTNQLFHRVLPESGGTRPVDQPVYTTAPVQPDLCDLCCVGRPHLLQEKNLRLRGPGPGSLLLSRLRQQAQQSVPGPEWTQPLPQRSVLAVRLPAVPLPGQYNHSSLGDSTEPLMLPENRHEICCVVVILEFISSPGG